MAARKPHVPPERYRTFKELPGFTRRWAALELPETDFVALLAQPMENPEAEPVIPETNGFRKARFAPPSWTNAGQSGALRVFYAHLPAFGVAILGSVISKSEAEDLSVAQRKRLGKLLTAFEKFLREERRRRLAEKKRKRSGGQHGA